MVLCLMPSPRGGWLDILPHSHGCRIATVPNPRAGLLRRRNMELEHAFTRTRARASDAFSSPRDAGCELLLERGRERETEREGDHLISGASGIFFALNFENLGLYFSTRKFCELLIFVR
jgi:hypothetical protein